MEFVAHRGCADHHPENTTLAVAEASKRLPSVEVDLRRCATGEVVAFHDEHVDEVTDGSGRFIDLDWETVRTLRVDGSDEPIPTLDEVLDVVEPGTTMQLELKHPGIATAVRDAVADRDLPVRISSFHPEALAEITRLDWTPTLGTGILFGVAPNANLDLAHVLGCENVHPSVGLCLDTDIVSRAGDAGLSVIAWGLEDTDAIPELRDLGVDGVTTDTWNVQ